MSSQVVSLALFVAFSNIKTNYRKVEGVASKWKCCLDKATTEFFWPGQISGLDSYSFLWSLSLVCLKGVSLLNLPHGVGSFFLTLFYDEEPPSCSFCESKEMVATSWRRYRKIHRHTIDKGLPKLAPWDLWGSKRSCFFWTDQNNISQMNAGHLEI